MFFETYEVPETLVMAALALIYVGLSFVDGESTQFLGQDRVQALIYVITAIFIGEFSIRLYAAESRLVYVRHHLFDLLAVLPAHFVKETRAVEFVDETRLNVAFRIHIRQVGSRPRQ